MFHNSYVRIARRAALPFEDVRFSMSGELFLYLCIEEWLSVTLVRSGALWAGENPFAPRSSQPQPYPSFVLIEPRQQQLARKRLDSSSNVGLEILQFVRLRLSDTTKRLYLGTFFTVNSLIVSMFVVCHRSGV